MTSTEIIEWASTHKAMIHFWRKPVVYLPGYKHTVGETVEEAVGKMQEQIERARKQKVGQSA